MAFVNLATRSTADANASADINVLMENIRVLGGNGTSAPTSDIESLKALVDAITAPASGAGAPGTTPGSLGLIYVDTTGDRVYISKGTASSADWEKQGKYESGTQTVTASGGDVAISLDWDWSGGLLLLHTSRTAAKYFDDAGNSFTYWTSYEALTNGSYTSDQISHFWITSFSVSDKGNNESGRPKSATTTSFTLDDDGANTVYVKWMVIA